MSTTLLPVKEDDLQTLADILNYYVAHTTVTFHTEPLNAVDMREKVFFSQPWYQSFTIRQDGSIIGYCAVSQWKKQQAYRHTAEINIYLKHGYTGKGFGSKAIEHLEAFAKRYDINNLIAGLCDENLPSRKLFEKNGYTHCASFKKVGQKFGRTLGTIYLQKILEE